MEIQGIVDALNAAPFHKHLSLVSFDEQSAFDLLHTVINVLGHINSDYAAETAHADQQTVAMRITEALKILNYKSPVSGEALLNGISIGDHSVVYPALYWLLQNLPLLKKRAYLARFLVNVAVPEDLFADEAVTESFEQYRQCREEFKELHKQVDKLRETSHDPTTVRSEITRLEQEKDQLTARTATLQSKLASTPNFDGMIKVISNLRRELDAEVKHKTALRQQQEQLTACENEHLKLAAKLKDLKSTSLSGGSTALLEKLREETEASARKCREDLPKELEARKEKEALLRSVLATGASEADVSALQRAIANAEREVAELKEQKDARDRQTRTEDSNLGLFRQQVQVLAKRKQDALDHQKAMVDERRKLEERLKEQEKKFEGLLGTNKVLSGAQFQQYAAALRFKNDQRKVLKADLNALRAELGVVQRTETLLQQRKAEVDQAVARVEKARGVSGYQDVHSKIESVSKDKAEIDARKGNTLEELSRVVERITTEIRDRKESLLPLVKALREARAKHAEVEAVYLEHKTAYENAKAGLDSKLGEVQREVGSFAADCQVEESRYHFLQCITRLQRITSAKVKDEAKGAKPSWKQAYRERIKALDEEQARLRKIQLDLKGSDDSNRKQLELFKDVKSLLEAKRRALQNDSGHANSGQLGDQHQGFTAGRADRFVLE